MLRAHCQGLRKTSVNLRKRVSHWYFGVKKFQQYIYGRYFMLFLLTDYKRCYITIVGPKTRIAPIAAAGLQRWAFALSAYRYTLILKKSNVNAEADYF